MTIQAFFISKGDFELRSLITFIASAVLLCVLTPCLYSQQSATATLNGTVKDPNGAVVTGATVTLTQRSTDIKRETITNDEGVYVLTNLAAGNYQLRVQATGFQVPPLDVILKVGQNTTLDVPLYVAGANVDPVIVPDTGSQIDQTSSKV